jgi:hypothetical protein
MSPAANADWMLRVIKILKHARKRRNMIGVISRCHNLDNVSKPWAAALGKGIVPVTRSTFTTLPFNIRSLIGGGEIQQRRHMNVLLIHAS